MCFCKKIVTKSFRICFHRNFWEYARPFLIVQNTAVSTVLKYWKSVVRNRKKVTVWGLILMKVKKMGISRSKKLQVAAGYALKEFQRRWEQAIANSRKFISCLVRGVQSNITKLWLKSKFMKWFHGTQIDKSTLVGINWPETLSNLTEEILFQLSEKRNCQMNKMISCHDNQEIFCILSQGRQLLKLRSQTKGYSNHSPDKHLSLSSNNN